MFIEVMIFGSVDSIMQQQKNSFLCFLVTISVNNVKQDIKNKLLTIRLIKFVNKLFNFFQAPE